MNEEMLRIMKELRAIGVHGVIHAGIRGKVGDWFEMRGSDKWGPELSRKVAEVLDRHGMRETREGLWSSANADEAATKRVVDQMREDDMHRHIMETFKSHPDWSDLEVAEACGVDADYVAELRNEFDR